MGRSASLRAGGPLRRGVCAGVVAALAAACDAPSPASYAAPPGTRVALGVVVREELAETGAARRLVVAARGAHEPDAFVRLDVTRAALETRDAAGKLHVVSTDAVGVGVPERDPADGPVVKLLESLRTASIRLRLDAAGGVSAVEGLDRVLDAAAARDASLADARAGLRAICSDEGWRESLRAAGLCDVPRAVRDRGAIRRDVRVRVPGVGTAAMPLDGRVETAADGLPVASLRGRLTADAVFASDGGAPPPADVGGVRVAEVTGTATTSYPPEPGPPFKGEFTLTVPFARGVTLRTTTTFTWTRL